jgi:hypothetical protein
VCADGAGFLDCSEDPDEKSWLLRFFFSCFQRRKETLRITNTSVMRKLSSGIVVVLAAFPKSAKITIIECTIDGSKVPKAADMEALKLRTSSEINEIMLKSGKSCSQKPSSALVTSLPQHAQIIALLENHLDAEARAGIELHPAAQSQNFSMEGKADDDCKCFFVPHVADISNGVAGSLQRARRRSRISLQCQCERTARLVMSGWHFNCELGIYAGQTKNYESKA